MEIKRVPIPKQGPVIAIDGPAGTGKSSSTRRLADELGYVHVDTGALYRSVGYMALESQLLTSHDLRSTEAIDSNSELAEKLTTLARELHIEFRHDSDRTPANRVFVNGVDVSDKIRTSEVSMAASKVSAVPGVRAALLGLQRRLGCVGKSILEGRDIGSVIFPDADVKFFLSASVEERAKRRLSELEALGQTPPSYEDVKKQIEKRDHADRTRSEAPLIQAPDAVEIDTTQYTLDEVVERMKKAILEKLKSS